MDKKIQNEIIKKLCELVKKCPDQRFGQILYNYYLEYVNEEQDPFYVNDKKSLEILKKCIDNLPNQCYNKDVIRKGEVKMNWKLKEITIKEVLQALTSEDISINDFYFYDEDVGYLQVNELYILEIGTVEIGNNVVNIKNEYELNDKIFIKTIDI